MILVVVVRRAVCEICGASFDLEADETPPDRCRVCASWVWNGDMEIRSQNRLRHGEGRKVKKLNPGATSIKRQQWGRKQWQGFKPKPVDAPKDSS